MSTTHSFSGVGKLSVKPGSSVSVVRFTGQFMIGRALEPMSTMTDGMRYRGGQVKLTYFNDYFLRVDFPADGDKAAYVQLIPWSAVSTLILE